MKSTFRLCLVVLAATVCTGYIPGNEYRYHSKGHVLYEMDKKIHQHAGFYGKGDVIVQIKGNSILVKIENPSMALVNERPDGKEEHNYVHIPSAAEYLEKPFQVDFNKNGLISDIKVEKDDTYWSVNMKKAIAARFQLNFNHANVVHDREDSHKNHSRFDNENYYQAMEEGILGECEVVYNVDDSPHNEIHVTKTKNYQNCKDLNYRVYENHNAHRCYECDKAIHTPIQLTDITHYELEGTRQNYVVRKMTMEERFAYMPLGRKAEYLTGDTKVVLELADIKKVEAEIHIPADAVTHNDVHFEFEEHFEIKTADDLKKAHNNFVNSIDKAPKETVYKYFDEMANVDDKKPYTEAFKDKPMPLLLIKLTAMLTRMSYDELKDMFTNHVIHGITDKEALNDRKRIFGNALVQAGTGPAFMFIKHAITEMGIDSKIATNILADLTMGLKEFSPVLFEEFYTLCEHPTVHDKPDVRSTCYLAFSSLMYEQCVKKDHTVHMKYPPVHKPHCTSKTAENYFNKMVKSHKGHVKDSHERITCIKTAGNFGTLGSLEYLTEIIHDTHLHPYFRFSAIWSLAHNSAIHPKQVLSLVMPIYYNTSEPAEIRNIALFQILFSSPELHHIEAIAESVEHEEDYQVQHYTVSTFTQVAHGHHPCEKMVTAMCKKVLRYFDRIPHVIERHDFRRSFTMWSDGFDYNYKLGGGTYFTYLTSNNSYVPRHVDLFIEDYVGLSSRIPITISYTGYGFDRVMDHFFGFLRRKGNTKVDDELKNVNEQLHLQHRKHEQVLGDFEVSVYGSATMFVHVNEAMLENQAEGGAQKLPELMEYLKDVEKYSFKRFEHGSGYKFLMPSAVGWPIFVDVKEIEFFHFRSNKLKLNIDPTLFTGQSSKDSPPTISLKTEGHLVHDRMFTVTAGAVGVAMHTVMATGIIDRWYHSIPLRLKFSFEPTTHKMAVKYTPVVPHTRIVRTFTPYTLLFNTSIFERDLNALVKDGSLLPFNKPNELVSVQKDLFHEYLGYGLHFTGTFSRQRKLDSRGSFMKFMMETNTRDKLYYLATNPKATMFHYEVSLTPASQDPTTEIDIVLNIDHTDFSTSDDYYKPSFPTVQDGHENYINSRGDRKASTCVLKAEKVSKGSRERKLITELVYTYTLDNLYHKLDFLYDRSPYSRNEKDHVKVCYSSSMLFPHIDVKKVYNLETVDMDPKIQVAADIHFGKNCENDRKITVRGELSRTEESQELQANRENDVDADEHENYDAVLYHQCKKDNEKGIHYSLNCRKYYYRALKLRHYSFDIHLENLNEEDKHCAAKMDNLVKLGLLYYLTDTPHKVVNASGHVHVEADFSAKTDHVDIRVRKPHETTEFTHVPHPEWIQARSATPFFGFTNKMVKSSRYRFPYCAIEGDHVKTFDDVHYELPPIDCYKVIAMDCTEKQIFAVLSKKIDHNTHSKALKIILPRIKIEAVPVAGKIAITFNGNEITVTEDHPYMYYEDDKGEKILTHIVTYNGLQYKFKSMINYGVTVYYDGKSVVVYLSPYYRGKQCGLCGDFNGNNVDEFLGPRHCVFENATDFVNSYALSGGCTVPALSAHCEPHPSYHM